MTSGAGKIVLYIDTASNTLMVGMSAEGVMLFKHRESSASHRYHSAMLIPVIEKGLKRLGVSVQDLNSVCVNVGPGSFTGIRTGIASVRTLAQFVPNLGGQVYGFNTFELLSGSALSQTPAHQPAFAVYLDALRDRAYHAMVGFDSTGPFYVKEPALVGLADRKLEKVPMIVSESLAGLPLFAESGNMQTPNLQTIESLDVFTPEVMQRLLAAYGEHFKKPWPELGPLYLQEPSITLSKRSG